MGLWGKKDGVFYRLSEFYFSSRQEQQQMTDEEYANALKELAGDRKIAAVIVDPSAASFIEVLRRRGWIVRKAKNDVLGGIRLTADALKRRRIVICHGCDACLREMDAYVWDLQGGNKERVKKENDHAMDDMRYFVSTVLGAENPGFAAYSVARKR
jgi:hypothetical protein